MSDKPPKNITPGVANRGSLIHASDAATVGILSRAHLEEDISRIQSAIHSYSPFLPEYKFNDLVRFGLTTYTNFIATTSAEPFDPGKWVEVNGMNGLVNVRLASDIPSALFADLTSVSDNGSGQPRFFFATPHGYTQGQTVQMENTTTYDGFHIINVIDANNFDVIALSFGATSTGDVTRCLAKGGAQYLIGTPVFTTEGYRGATGASYFIEARNPSVNNIIMVGVGQTLLFQRGTGGSLGSQINLKDVILVDGTSAGPTPGTNTLFDVDHGAGLADVVVTDNVLFVGFDDLGNLKNTFTSIRNAGALIYDKGLKLTNVRGNAINWFGQFGAAGSTLTTLDNLPANVGTFGITLLNSQLGPGTDVLDIKASNDLSNSVTIENSQNNFGADFFKKGTNATGVITTFAGTPGANPVTVTSTAHGRVNGERVNISLTTNYNGIFFISGVTTNTFNITVPDGFVVDDATGTWTQVRIITNVANAAANAGSITSAVSNGAGKTTIFADTAGTLQEGASITITGTTSYNVTVRVYNVLNGQFDIPVSFVADETGSWSENKLVLNVLAHGLTLATPVLLDKTIDYDGGSTVQEVVDADIIEIAGVFTFNNFQGEVRDGSLTKKALNVLLKTVSGETDSKAKGSFTVFGNVATTVLGVNVFTDLNLAAMAVETNDTELWRLIDSTTGELEYRGIEPFSGQLTGTLFGQKVGGGGNVDYVVRAVRNGGRMIDNVRIPFSAGTDTVSAPLTIPITAVFGDRFKLQSLQVTGDDITVESLTVVIQ